MYYSIIHYGISLLCDLTWLQYNILLRFLEHHYGRSGSGGSKMWFQPFTLHPSWPVKTTLENSPQVTRGEVPRDWLDKFVSWWRWTSVFGWNRANQSCGFCKKEKWMDLTSKHVQRLFVSVNGKNILPTRADASPPKTKKFISFFY